MKNRIVKSVISLLLIIVLISAVPLSTYAVTLVYYPVIYVAGAEESVIYENPNKTKFSVKFGLKDTSFTSAFLDIAAAIYMNDKNTSASVLSKLDSMLSPIACNDQGKVKNPNTGTWYYNNPLSYYPDDEINTKTLNAITANSGGRITKDDIYVFTSDWRVDPFESAALLRDYIDYVIGRTGSKKVTLLCGGEGGVAGETYIYEYESHAKANVDSVIFMNCPLWGNGNIGDLMSGDLYQTAGDASSVLEVVDIIKGKARGEAFNKYIQADPSSIISDMLTGFVGEGTVSDLIKALIISLVGSIMDNEDADQELGKRYNDYVIKNEEVLGKNILRKYLRNMPGLWALVPPEYYDDALDYMFGDEMADETLYDTIQSFRPVMNNINSVLSGIKNAGVKVYVIANYGVANLPLTASINHESDGILTTRNAAAGATTLECGLEWEGYSDCLNAYHDHLDPNGELDASTCALPENTWFIRELPHMDFSCESASLFLIWLMTSDSQQTVWDRAIYPQFMSYNKIGKSIRAFTNIDDPASYMYGDADFDGKVTPADARKVLRISIGLEDTHVSKVMLTICDVDASGYIEVTDARLILRRAINLDRSFSKVE